MATDSLCGFKTWVLNPISNPANLTIMPVRRWFDGDLEQKLSSNHSFYFWGTCTNYINSWTFKFQKKWKLSPESQNDPITLFSLHPCFCFTFSLKKCLGSEKVMQVVMFSRCRWQGNSMVRQGVFSHVCTASSILNFLPLLFCLHWKQPASSFSVKEAVHG